MSRQRATIPNDEDLLFEVSNGNMVKEIAEKFQVRAATLQMRRQRLMYRMGCKNFEQVMFIYGRYGHDLFNEKGYFQGIPQ